MSVSEPAAPGVAPTLRGRVAYVPFLRAPVARACETPEERL